MMSEKTPDAKSDRVPSDLIPDILLRLPARSISRFRCVSKSWLSITTDPSFLLAHTSRSSNSLLIHTTKNHSDGSDLRSISLQLLSPAPTPSADRLVISTVLPERRRSSSDVVLASCDGLICLRDKLRETLELEEDVPCYYVVNPLSGFHINVPKPSCSLGHLMGLYFHPPTREYRLIRRISSNSILDKVELTTLGGDAWRTIDASPPRASVCARTPINLNGSLYWIAYNTTEFKATDILQFDTMEEEFNLMPLPLVNLHLFANSSLIDMGERLGLSIIDRELSSLCKLGIDIWVLKDNESFRWEQMYSVRCSGGKIDFRFGYSVDDIALFTKGKMVVLFVGPRSYLVQFDLNSRKYYTEQILDLEDIMWHFSLLHKESLISYDSFCNNR